MLTPSLIHGIGAFQKAGASGRDLMTVVVGGILILAIAGVLTDMALVKLSDPLKQEMRVLKEKAASAGGAAGAVRSFVSSELGIGGIAAIIVLLIDIVFIRPAERQEIAKESAKQTEEHVAATITQVLDEKERNRSRDSGAQSNRPNDVTIDPTRQKQLEDSLTREKAERFTDLYQQGRFNESERKFQEILNEIAEIPEAYHGLGQALLGENRPDDALTAFQEASRLAPANPDYHYHIAALNYGKGDYEGAVKEYQALVNLVPNAPDALSAAITLNPDNRTFAGRDSAFSDMRDDSEFRALVGS